MENFDLDSAFGRMENDLIDRLIKSLKLNNASIDYTTGDIDSWYYEQLKQLERFRNENRAYFTQENEQALFDKISYALTKQYLIGSDACKALIISKIKQGFEAPHVPSENLSAGARFAGVNDRKLKALIQETNDSLRKAATSAVTYTEQRYARIISDAKTYFESNSCTLATAIDTATHDFLNNGINCVQYKDGKCINVQSYSEMVLRTANKRSYLYGEGTMRDEFGTHLVIVTRRGDACPRCMRYVGRVFIDNVYSNGTADEGNYPLLSEAIAGGLYHPNCRDTHTTYFEGITTAGPTPTKEEEEEAERIYNLQQKQRYLERQVRGSDRMARGAMEDVNREKYEKRKAYFQKQLRELVASEPKLKRRYYREKNLIK